jgi:hypothetical protein
VIPIIIFSGKPLKDSPCVIKVATMFSDSPLFEKNKVFNCIKSGKHKGRFPISFNGGQFIPTAQSCGNWLFIRLYVKILGK